ncbi:ACP S-malonyltransferase [Legionella geestiana]|nr:ACP S-malonyltransferase [Legionella geestiana]
MLLIIHGIMHLNSRYAGFDVWRKPMTVCVFPGQGSQWVGMGRELFEHFKAPVREASLILGYDIQTLCLEDPEHLLDNTRYTQPALFVINALAWRQWRESFHGSISFLAGHSLGEYNALHIAGVFDFATGLRIVQKRAELSATVNNGSMAAVIGLGEHEIQRVLVLSGFKNLYIANYNSPSQFVIAGDSNALMRATPLFLEAGAKRFIPLKVNGAFHTPLVREASEAFAEFLQDFSFNPPKIPVIANLNAMPYPAHTIAGYLACHMMQPVRWTQSIEHLLIAGEQDFVECGARKVLTPLINAIKKGPSMLPS